MPTTAANFGCWLVSNTTYLKKKKFLQTPSFSRGNSKLPAPRFLENFQKLKPSTLCKGFKLGLTSLINSACMKTMSVNIGTELGCLYFVPP